jgi:hypothetical protein
MQFGASEVLLLTWADKNRTGSNSKRIPFPLQTTFHSHRGFSPVTEMAFDSG